MNKDIKVSNNAFDIFKKIVKLENDEAYDAVNKWIEKNEIETFDEIYAYEKDVDEINLSKSQKDMMHIMSLNTYNETMDNLEKIEKGNVLKTIYHDNSIHIDGTKNVIQWGDIMLMEMAFVFYYKR